MRTTEDRASGELREGYADIGDQRLHYVEAGEGPLAAGFRVVAPDMRGYNLSSKPDGVHACDTGLLAADIAGLIRERGAGSAMLAGHYWGGSVAWATAMACPEVVDRLAILNAAHPRKLAQGLHHPGQLRKSWYFFFFDLPEAIVHAGRWHYFRHFLHDAHPAYTPEEMDRYLQAWPQRGAATGMINYYRPRCGLRPNRPKRRCAPSRRPRWSSGGRPIATSARNSPSPTTTTCPASTASSACPTPRTGCIHDEAKRVTHLLTGFFAPALAK